MTTETTDLAQYESTLEYPLLPCVLFVYYYYGALFTKYKPDHLTLCSRDGNHLGSQDPNKCAELAFLKGDTLCYRGFNKTY